MRQIIRSIFLLLVVCSLGLGQNRKNEPRLLGYFGPNDEDVLNEIYKLSMFLESSFNSQEDTFAVRVCSNETLPVALALGRGAPFLTTLKLEKLGIPKSSMFYLRQNKNCKLSPNNYALTEYWLIPKNAEFPEFVEARRASHLSGNQLTNADNLVKEEPFEVRNYELEKLTPQSYKIILDELIKLLKKNKSAVTVIQVPYYRHFVTAKLNKRVIDTQKYLQANGIASHRLYVRKIYSGSTIPSFIAEPKYPNIFVVSEN